MDEPRSDRMILAAALEAEARTAAGDHPETDLLLDYHAGRLDADAAERLQDHLVGCRRCARLLLELAPLAEPDPGDEETVADFEMNASLRKLEARIENERAGPKPAAPAEAGGRGIPSRSSPVVLRTVAAALFVAVVGLAAWGVRLRGVADDLRRRLDDLDQPRPNVAVAYLEPMENRGTAPVPAELAPAQPFWVLVLIPEDPRPQPEYEVALLDSEGRELWRERGFEMSAGGGISLALPRRMLPPGSYRLRLHAVVDDQRIVAGEYLLHVPSD